MAQPLIDIADQKQFQPQLQASLLPQPPIIVQPQALPGIDEDLKYELEPLDIDPNTLGDANRKRRFSVSAEPSADKKQKFVKKVYPKSNDALLRIREAIIDVFLFQGLDNEQSSLLIDAMFEKKVKIDDDIITQGDRGDYFYVIESGIYEVWKSSDIKLYSNPSKVFTYNTGGSFGELALMYNSPRAATVRATTAGTLWAVDRLTFRHIIVECTSKKRGKYDDFLKDIPLLLNLDDELRSSIADVLETFVFKKNDYIILENDANPKHFYFIQNGEVAVTQKQKNGNFKIIKKLHNSDYFGERALLINDVRSANIRVLSDVCECVAMDKPSFMRLLSPLYDKFRQNFKNYVFSNYTDNDDNALSDID